MILRTHSLAYARIEGPGLRHCGLRSRRPWPARAILVIVIIFFFASIASAKPPAKTAADPDDRLAADDQKLVTELTERCMPELVEELLAGRPPMYQAYVARAYARAGLESKEPEVAERFCVKAAEIYRSVLELGRDADWFHGERRRLDVAQWHVELADLVLRRWALADLDRREITSGLDFDRDRLTGNLREAQTHYIEAKGLLDDLLIVMRTEEERLMLLGITERIERLARQRSLSAAWTSVYWGSVIPLGQTDRDRRLREALAEFDAVSGNVKDSATKYNALIGAGIALRESMRYEEALAALNRVIASTAGPAVVIRARYEKARCLIASGQFDAGRAELDALAAGPKKNADDEGQDFYVRIAPLISAYSFVLQSRSRVENSPEAQRLLVQARTAFERVALRGGSWEEIAGVYLRDCGGVPTDPAMMSESDLRAAARRAMTKNDVKEALRIFGALEGKLKPLPAEDAFNQAVCLSQSHETRRAAAAFATLADRRDAGALAEKAAEYSYRLCRDLARETKTKQDHLALAGAADRLASRFATNALAADALWVGALAFLESADYSSAITQFARVAETSPNYWSARRNIARCRALIFESLPTSTSAAKRQGAASEAANALIGFAKGFAAKKPDDRRDGVVALWAMEARLQAATILARDDVRLFKESLSALENLPSDARVTAIRITSCRGLGDLEGARRSVTELLRSPVDAVVVASVRALVADLESEATRLFAAGKKAESQRAATASIPTVQRILEWTLAHEESRSLSPAIRMSLAELLRCAGRLDEAMAQLDRLMEGDPTNGRILHLAARLAEEVSERAAITDKPDAADKAEALWSRLLKDSRLRDTAPPVYWEARLSWLTHQRRHKNSAAVVRAIESERAWYPELGGPPWQGLLLDLAEKARAEAPEPNP